MFGPGSGHFTGVRRPLGWVLTKRYSGERDSKSARATPGFYLRHPEGLKAGKPDPNCSGPRILCDFARNG